MTDSYAARRVEFRLRPEQQQAAVPDLDAAQRSVVEHPGGPLLVLAGPGTGKTTTLVEAIVDRIESRGADPESVLALTFSRKAAEQMRQKVTARLGRTTTAAMSSTFHSFAYGLIRRYAPKELYEAPLRLLSAPEQDVVLRELLTDHPESVQWPETLRRALGTRGFAREVQAVLSRAREKGVGPEELVALGETEGLPELRAAGLFLDQYLTTLDNHSATDYADLIRRATIEAQVHREELRAQYAHVFVDEYQDTDPGQVALLQAIAGDGRDLTVVGDPHQSIYGFRGAEVRGILEFPDQFRFRDGRPGDVVALGVTRRFGPRILVAAQRVAGRLGLPGAIGEEAREAFTRPRCEAGGMGEGRVQVRTFDTERAEAEHLADLLRRAHLEDGVDWDEMAVLVRSGRTSLPGLRRSLVAAGVPVEIASDDIPLVRDPAVLPLLDGLRAVINLEGTDPDDADHLDAGAVEAILMGPLGGLDAGDVRRLARLLRRWDKARGEETGQLPAPSRELVRRMLVEPAVLDDLSAWLGKEQERDPLVQRARAVVDLLHRARAGFDAGASAEELLWTLWSGTRWPERLRRASENGGGAARRAHRDLDAICALFEVAARSEEQRDHLGVRAFLETLVAQRIPGDTLADKGVRGSAVRLLTAHRSKGLQWRLVVVAHVQAEQWPDLRRRATLLGADRIGTHGTVPPTSVRELLAEERRLFYVACTRARQRLVVTAVKEKADDGEQPSRFLDELGVTVEHVSGRPVRPLSMAGLVSELRRTAADPESSPALRQAAARRLARLAGEEQGDRPLVPSADPSSWWGTRSSTRSVEPVRPADKPVPVSASMLDGLAVCPARWFLTREAGGAGRAHQSANLGQLVHALAERVAEDELEAGPEDVDVLMEHVDAVWGRLEFRTPWSRQREYERIRRALGRFLRWHHQNRRTLLGTEQRFSCEVAVADGERVRLTGYADRLELDHEGRVVVVDLKTGRGKVGPTGVSQHGQLALYQYAVDNGAVDDLVRDRGEGEVPAVSGGGELIQLGLTDDSTDALPEAQERHDDDHAQRAALREHLARAAQLIRTETFPAVAGTHCKDCDFVPVCPIKSAGPVVAQ